MFNKKILFIILICILIIILSLFVPWNKILRFGKKNLVSGNGNLYVEGTNIYNKKPYQYPSLDPVRCFSVYPKIMCAITTKKNVAAHNFFLKSIN